MRLWTLHPKHLDRQGLLALWREGLLARAVLHGQTRGYRHHPQLERFRSQAVPEFAIDAYLAAVQEEASARGYAFDRSKLGVIRPVPAIAETTGQLEYEWRHLLRKLAVRNPALAERWQAEPPACHPLFVIAPGPIAPWERP
ncbi:pyrimidine dimer DNA glycosylase/endonuclease V [Frateuria sp. STR12]|uniref:pyrimidine dimer DNA glycosylase/endonuclease V n=1 Tax=Frateuria hangzhouensis TaxID=2995589 RepID=UPI002260E6D5|nr:pyrimidine dimer DNA glycosylase/endonuclease V [Frateuria sp. STR12]MCX7515121.1 pyrimidine dimer DNA glycosylase/endonuclease V [Frateuria sp. STR12]